MRFLKNRRMHVNMGPYEHVEITATVDVDTTVDADGLKELGVDPSDPQQVMDFVDEQLDQFMASDLEDAAVYTAEEDSFVLPYVKDRTTNTQKRN